MAETKSDEGLLPHERRKLVVNGRRYFAKTRTRCTTCMSGEWFLYLKLKLDATAILECINCDSIMSVPFETVPEAQEYAAEPD